MENTNNEVGRNLWRETIKTLIAAGKAHALHADAVVKAARDIEEIIESAIPAKAGKTPTGLAFCPRADQCRVPHLPGQCRRGSGRPRRR